MKSDNQIVGNVGLYYVCYQLSLRSWNVLPTSRNARGIDIIAYNSDASSKITVQVKSLSKRNAVILGAKLDHLFGDFVVICRNVMTDSPECFILTPNEVRNLAKRGNSKDSGSTFWLEPREYEQDQFREAWHRIGSGMRLLQEVGSSEG